MKAICMNRLLYLTLFLLGMRFSLFFLMFNVLLLWDHSFGFSTFSNIIMMGFLFITCLKRSLVVNLEIVIDSLERKIFLMSTFSTKKILPHTFLSFFLIQYVFSLSLFSVESKCNPLVIHSIYLYHRIVIFVWVPDKNEMKAKKWITLIIIIVDCY